MNLHLIRHKSLVLAFLALLMVPGCVWDTPLFIDTAVQGPKLHASDPRPVVMRDIQFIILSQENIDQYLPDILSGDLVIFGVDTEDYKDMSINTLQLLNYIKAQKSVIAAYREFYEPE